MCVRQKSLMATLITSFFCGGKVGAEEHSCEGNFGRNDTKKRQSVEQTTACYGLLNSLFMGYYGTEI